MFTKLRIMDKLKMVIIMMHFRIIMVQIMLCKIKVMDMQKETVIVKHKVMEKE